MKDRSWFERIDDMNPHLPKTDELRIIIRRNGFNVKVLAVHVGLGVRTLERRFSEQFRTTPKAWIIRERMNSAPLLLAEGLSNKQVAANLNYTCESNFCRDFKRCFGCAPQEFARTVGAFETASHSDKELSRIDKRAELCRQSASGNLGSCSSSNSKGSRPAL